MTTRKGLLGMPEWQNMLANFRDDLPLSQLAMHIGLTYSHAHKIMNLLEKKELVAREKKGRVWKMELTNKGMLCKEAILVLMEQSGGKE